MNKTAKVILSSVLSMGLCASIIAGSTFALFTSEDNVNIAITSGKVDVEASITSLATNSDATVGGSLEDITDWQDATPDPSSGSFTGEFATGGTATYSVTDGVGTLALEQIVPGDAVKFTFTVTNESTISVKYQIRMRTTEDEYVGGAEDPKPGTKLSSALEVKLGEEDVKSGLVYAASAWTAADAAAPETVVYIRLPKDVGNEYQQRKCSISLSVLAVQGNAKETTYCEENGHKIENDVCIYCGFENPFKGASNHDDTGTTYVIKGADPTVTELEIPAEINGKKVELTGNAFIGNTSLTSVKIDEGFEELPDCVSSEKGLFSKCSDLEHVELPSSLKKIGSYAFSACSSLQDIEIPDGVTEIGHYAFYDTGLESVTIPDSVTNLKFGTFSSCDNLTSVKLGKGITEIQYYTFSGCTALKDIEMEGAITTIGHQAFQKTGLETFTMPDTVTTLEYSAFYQCASLTNVVLGANLETIGNNAFDGCTSLETVTFNGANLTSLGQCAFKDTALTSIDIPDSVTKIGVWAFQNCSNLANVTFGEGVQSIESRAFEGCSALTEISLPDTVTNIGSSAFENCSKLKTVNIGTVDSQLTTFGSAAFNFCYNITDINFAGTTEEWKSVLDSMGTSTVKPFVYATKATVHCTNGTLDHNGDPITG